MNQETENYMSKITSLIRRAPKRFTAVIAMVAAAVIIPAVALASWGPDRPTYDWNGPAADHVVFNSFTNNPVHGDERNFMRVREASQPASAYVDNIALQANKEYVIHIYYHNNASTTLNDAAHNYAGIATGAYVKAEIPGKVASGSAGTVSQGYIGASNAVPQVVWDDVKFSNNTGSDLGLQYVAGSAKINNFGATNGQTLSDSVVTTGAPIGYNALDGKVPGCNEFSGYVTFRVKTVPSSYTIQKQVRLAGDTEYKENVTAKPGDTLEYRIEYKNTGSIQHNNVVIKDTLPAHVSYVTGSTTLKNTNFPTGKTISDNLTTSGVNIGDYLGGGNAFVKFKATVASADKLLCGTNTLTNKASAQVGTQTKEDTASTTVNIECEPGKINVCEIASKKIIKINEDQFDAQKHTKDLSKCDVPKVPELPKTGPTENIVAIVGLSALIASIAYYVASRRALNQ
jgi:uncharacterized repeat protein (TIGR01451 family)